MFISSIDTGLTPMPALLPDQGKERETRSTYLTGHIGLLMHVLLLGWIFPQSLLQLKILVVAWQHLVWINLPSYYIYII